MPSLIASVNVISSYFGHEISVKTTDCCHGGTPMALYDHVFGLLLDIYDEAVDSLLLAADSIKKILPSNSYAEQNVYLLPPAEWVSKYVSLQVC